MAVLMHPGMFYSFSDAQASRSNGRTRTSIMNAPSSSTPPNPAATPTATNAQVQQQQPRSYRQEEELEVEAEAEVPFPSLFCRALYDYESHDNSALSFRRGDIIEALTQQPSGWWDGLLGDERGWFPSNYVVVISEEEAEQVFSVAANEVQNQPAEILPPSGMDGLRGREIGAPDGGLEVTPTASAQFGRLQAQQVAQHSKDVGIEVDLSHALLRGGLVARAEGQQWVDGSESKFKPPNGHAESNISLSSQSSDFWMPRVTPDNQIYYLNTHTGQQSRDLPLEAEESVNSELASFTSQSSSQVDTGSVLPYRSGRNDSSSSDKNIAGFDFFNRSSTPEPWTRRLADDGYTYYYLNKADGSVLWTRPESSGPVTRDRSGSIPQSVTVSLTHPSSTSPDKFEDSSRLSVYSDDSDVQPIVPQPRKPRSNGVIRAKDATLAPTSKGLSFDQTSAERTAKILQQTLAPPPPELVADLSAAAKFSIQAVMENIKPNDLTRHSEDDQRMDDLINGVVHAVRDLLYVSAAPTGHIPSSVLPPGYKGYKFPSQSPLKPAQRKVTATLSRLVLSARAMQYDSGIVANDTRSRIQSDAEELEKAVLSFVIEVQGTRHTADARPLKRLAGFFSTANIGLGLIGAGAAGTWKGFGWVPLAHEPNLPKRLLTPDVTATLASLVSRLEEKTTSFSYTLRVLDESSADQLHVRGQDLITELSVILNFVADIHVARHVAIDGIPTDGSFTNDIYASTVEKARLLVRTLEASIQAAYDDGMSLLMTTQSISADEFGQNRIDKGATYERLDTLCLSLKANTDLVQQTLEGLLAVGHEQADTAQGEYNGSIEWRLSKLSVIHKDDSLSLGDEDMVDMEYAINGGNKGVIPLGLPDQSDEQEDENLSTQSGEAEDDAVPEPQASPGIDDEIVGKSPPRQNGAKSKLAQIFGAEYADKVAMDSQPWYLQANYDPSEILLDSDGMVRGGTLVALVERLTSHDQLDTSYNKSFLMTFKSFTTVGELFDLLVARFRIQAPPNLTPQEQENWEKLKQRLIQIRVLNTLKAMINDEDVMDKEDAPVLDRMLDFLKSNEVSHLNAAKTLIMSIERIKSGGDPPKQTQNNPGAPPPPIAPRTTKKLKLVDIEPLELARQLTIKESELYRKIKPIECLLRAREQKSENMDNIATVIQTSNRIADWVAESILSKEDSRKRSTIVKHLITVADRCRTLNNFSTMIAITSGLNTPPIRRLKRTWEQVNQRTMAQFVACEATIDSKGHFKEYRRMMQIVNPPCVPFIGVFLTDLQFIQDGNPDMLSGGLINFRKRQMLSEVIGNIKRWQAQPFNLAPVPIVTNYIEESLSQFNDTKASSDRFWEMSMEREPREREDEKMARLLQESGFL